MVIRFRIRLVDGIFMPEDAQVERVMDVPGSFTVEDLVKEILDSIEFDFDHLYSLYVKGKEYAGAPCSAPAKERCRVKLQTIALNKGDLMTLVYDYGDDWQFEIAVMQVSSEKAFGAKLISSKGKVEQYPNLDEYGMDEEALEREFGDMSDVPDDDSAEDFFQEGGLPEGGEWTYTMPPELMDAAFAYKKAKVWKKLWSRDIFAIRFSDGEIGYISVMGKEGEHCALGVYCGDTGFRSVWALSFEGAGSFYEQQEVFMRQDCVQLILDNKEYLDDVEIEAAKAYAAEHGLRFAGKNAFPHVKRFWPYRFPWAPEAEDEQHLLEAIDAVLVLGNVLKKKLPSDLGIEMFAQKAQDLLLIEKKDETWSFDGRIHVEPPEPDVFLAVEPTDEELIRKIRRRKKKGRFACKLVRMPQFVNDERGNAVMPMLLGTLDQDSGYALPPVIRLNYDEADMSDLVHEWLLKLQDLKVHPALMEVPDARSYALLKGAADQLGCPIRQEESLPDLEMMFEDMFRSISSGEYDDIEDAIEEEENMLFSLVHMVLLMSDKDIRKLKSDVRQELFDLLDLHILPPDLQQKLEEKLKVLKRR